MKWFVVIILSVGAFINAVTALSKSVTNNLSYRFPRPKLSINHSRSQSFMPLKWQTFRRKKFIHCTGAHGGDLGDVEGTFSNFRPCEFTLRGLTYCDVRQCPLPSVELFRGSEISLTTPSSHNVLLDWVDKPSRILFLAKLDPDNYLEMRAALLSMFSRGLEIVVEESFLDFLSLEERKHGQMHIIEAAIEQRSKQQQQQQPSQQPQQQKKVQRNLKRQNNTQTKQLGQVKFNNSVVDCELAPSSAVSSAPSGSQRPPELILFQPDSTVDLIVTFGGDGLLLHCNTLFGQRAVPPIMSFDFGSLGFLSPFLYENFDEELDCVLQGGIVMTLRMRLECTIWRNQVPNESFCVLNEAVVDRGPSPYLSVLDLSCDNQYITTLQGDGIIFATPTGSTAYSLAAGGSVVYPSVPAILLTPVCAHSLSFRPMLLPDTAVLTCTVPEECRSHGWVSFDGKFRRELELGDWLEVRMSPNPLPTVNRKNFTGDWLDSLRAGFMYNVRKRQKPK